MRRRIPGSGYVRSAPSDQTALDLFRGEWSSALPTSRPELRAGYIPLFEDPRITWALDQIGGVAGQRVLELGPLEGGHTYMLEQAGAESILAIEANRHAFLRCLVTKEILGLGRSRFLLGDFVEYLRVNDGRFDVCLASGVLYHVPDPAELIHLISRVTDRIILWTHYYDKVLIGRSRRVRRHFRGKEDRLCCRGFEYSAYRYDYGRSLNSDAFCGGAGRHGNWVPRDQILACLDHFGFRDLRIGFDERHHVNGPAFLICGRQG